MTRPIVFAPNWLGDAVMALPAIADLQRALPDIPLAVAARPTIAPLFSMVSGVSSVVIVGDRAVTADALRRARHDTAILLTNSFNTALLARQAGVAERWGYRGDCRTILLTRAASPPVGLHQAAYYQHLVRELGFRNGPSEPNIAIVEPARTSGAALLRRAGWNGESPLVALAPGAAYGSAKRWPPESFAALACDLIRDDLTPVLIGSGADAPTGREVLARTGAAARVIDVIGQTDLAALAGVLTHCRALVTNDSGAMHFAAALGVNVVALFGPTNERETAPRGPGRRVVLTHDVWCRPCMLRECPLTHGCMRGITVDAVREATRITISAHDAVAHDALADVSR